MALTRLNPGDRVEYRFNPTRSGGDPRHNGARGTVEYITDIEYQGQRQVRVIWDHDHKPSWPITPFEDNLVVLQAEVIPLTTEYEADTHHDDIAHPSHYTDGRKYEPKDVIRDWGLGFNLGAVVKYVARAGRKADTPTLKDLRKARQFLDFEIEALEAEAAK